MALLGLSSWCLVIVVWLSLAVTWVCLRSVIVVFPDHTHYFLVSRYELEKGLNQESKISFVQAKLHLIICIKG